MLFLKKNYLYAKQYVLIFLRMRTNPYIDIEFLYNQLTQWRNSHCTYKLKILHFFTCTMPEILAPIYHTQAHALYVHLL